MKSRFKVYGQLDRGGHPISGTVEIDRKAGTFTVRPHRSRKTYTTALSVVADIIVQRMVKAEVREKEKEKAKLKRERRKRR